MWISGSNVLIKELPNISFQKYTEIYYDPLKVS